LTQPARGHRRQAPARSGNLHRSGRGAARRSGPLRSYPVRWIVVCALAVVVLLAWGAVARAFAPKGNTVATHFDAIIVLGYPADSDGNPTPEQLARVSEGVREYGRGVAPRLIMTGGPAHNKVVEAESMARVARAQGVPDSAIVLEPQATSTMENACFSERIMQQHGWRSAEVVTSEYHLPRSGMIFSRTSLEWRTHAAPSVMGQGSGRMNTVSEVLKTMRYLLYARWADSCSP
jgi:uncharacterized SAM-binding protein YcdF (DUF218 family)